MPTDDRQILVTGTADAPADWLVPGNGQIRPKVVHAVYDGTSASGSFIPVLQVISDAGVVVGEYVAPTVAAGASVAQSWFPRVAGQAAAATGAPASALLSRTTSKTFTGNVGYSMEWANFFTTDTTVFGTNPFGTTTLPPHNTAGDVNVMLLKPGAYVAELTVKWQSGTANFFAEIQALASDYADIGAPTAIGDLASTTAPMTNEGDFMTQSVKLVTVTASSTFGAIYALAEGQTNANYTVTAWTMVVHWLGGGIGVDTTVY